jgi:hypothetical protein
MNPKTLSKWCLQKRGRASFLARVVGRSREFIRQMQTGQRPIPEDLGAQLVDAMAKVEKAEAGISKATAAALK